MPISNNTNSNGFHMIGVNAGQRIFEAVENILGLGGDYPGHASLADGSYVRISHAFVPLPAGLLGDGNSPSDMSNITVAGFNNLRFTSSVTSTNYHENQSGKYASSEDQKFSYGDWARIGVTDPTDLSYTTTATALTESCGMWVHLENFPWAEAATAYTSILGTGSYILTNAEAPDSQVETIDERSNFVAKLFSNLTVGTPETTGFFPNPEVASTCVVTYLFKSYYEIWNLSTISTGTTYTFVSSNNYTGNNIENDIKFFIVDIPAAGGLPNYEQHWTYFPSGSIFSGTTYYINRLFFTPNSALGTNYFIVGPPPNGNSALQYTINNFNSVSTYKYTLTDTGALLVSQDSNPSTALNTYQTAMIPITNTDTIISFSY